MNCPACLESHTHLLWAAMETWDYDSWECENCGHTWAAPASQVIPNPAPKPLTPR